MTAIQTRGDAPCVATRRAGVAAVALLAIPVSPRARAVTFTDVTTAAGISHVQSTPAGNATLPGTAFMTGGVAAGDFNNDGLTDLVFTRLGDTDILYRNLGGGVFEPRTTTAGFSAATLTNGVVSGDIDNDGDLDLYMTGGAGDTRNYLYLNDGSGAFTDAGTLRNVALANGKARNGQGSSFGDYNNDGYLDLMVGDWGHPAADNQSRLFLNRGATQPGFFDDVTVAAGLDVYRKDTAYRFAPRFVDLDRDGHLDLTIASDFMTSQLFWNNGDGTFTDGTLPAGVGTDFNGMGTAFADYDGDGDLDWFITNITNAPENPGGAGGWNRLYRNNGGRTFTDVTQEAGVRDSRWSWGTTFFDADNDADADLIATNGWNGIGWADDRTYFWTNDGGVFTDVSDAAGITDTAQGRGLAHLDYDGDGDLDLVVVNHEGAPVLYRNNTMEMPGPAGSGAYLRLHTEGTASNRDGIGAFITVTADLADPDTRQVWEVDGGSSFLSQNEHTAHFGLGIFEGNVDLVTIEWPSGLVQHLHGTEANQTLTVVETDQAPAQGDVNFDGVLDSLDLDWLRVALDDPTLYAALFGVDAEESCDLNGDGNTDAGDTAHLLTTVLGGTIGDANLNGQVEQGDLDAVLQNWGQAVSAGMPGGAWANGDLSGDGAVDQADLDAVLQNWGVTTAPDFGGFDSSRVPEPGAAALVVAVFALTRCRRCKTSEHGHSTSKRVFPRQGE